MITSVRKGLSVLFGVFVDEKSENGRRPDLPVSSQPGVFRTIHLYDTLQCIFAQRKTSEMEETFLCLDETSAQSFFF